MYSKYYQQELFNIRELAREFAEKHPAIAPMLSGQSTDPDVERLLEGTAFLTAMLRQKLDDQLPEVIHNLTGFIFPHFLKTIPSLTIVRFTPKKGLQETLTVPQGTTLASMPVEDEPCLFRTCFACDVHPLKVTAAEADKNESRGRRQKIRVSCELTGSSLSAWQPDHVSFFIGGAYSRASDLFMLLNSSLAGITVQAEGGAPCTLPPQNLKPIGNDRSNSLLPFDRQSFSGYRLLQEYFILQHKFLFLELSGWQKWRNRGDSNRFTITFELSETAAPLPPLGKDSFILGTVPAINLFEHNAEPVTLDHTLDKIRISPAPLNKQRPRIYSVNEVTGYTRGAVKKKEYQPITRFVESRSELTYNLLYSNSPVDDTPEIALQFPYPPSRTDLTEETLSISLTCTNGDLPIQLQPGDISIASSDSPELVEFANLTQPTLPIEPPLEGNHLWQLLSHLSLNLLSLASENSLRELLSMYIFRHGRDKGRVSANEKRISGIEGLVITRINRLVRGEMMHGQKLTLTMRSDHFASIGDFWLFGMVLDEFFSEYCSMNTFTQLDVYDSITGETFSWTPRIGSTQLI